MNETAESLIQQLKAFDGSNSVDHIQIDDDKRQELILACQKASSILESPFESMQRVNYSVCHSNCDNH
jgi:hypothetical protein